MRQMEEKHIANQVDLMVWGQRLDLLALSNIKGEVQVHRLSWHKVWNLAPKENTSVGAMAWRPDGKAIAVGYDTGCVRIISIEDKEILNNFDLTEDISEEFENPNKYSVTFISWVTKKTSDLHNTEYNIYEDYSIFLPKPPPLNTSYKNQNNDDGTTAYKDTQDQNQLNVLIVACGRGYIHLSIFGKFPFCTISLPELLNDEYGDYKILDITLSDDFSVMHVSYLDKASNNVFIAVINSIVLSAYAEEVFVVANRYVQIVQLLLHVDQTMVSIIEAWEHIILEMDSKMADYAMTVPDGAVSADFLELLMMGTPSDELELFLLQELTTKGLKKFGSSVELSYSTIQKLVLKQLNIVGQSLTYHLAELRGLSRIQDRYKILGLEESTITEAIRSSCAFLNKCLELQQVIDISMRNYKAFFRWLYGVIVRLLDEQAPSEIIKVTQQDLSYIAEFLYNFDNVKIDRPDHTTERPVRFNLERLSQYLQDQDLTIVSEDEDNPWQNFLNENPCLLKSSDTILSMSEFKKYSLVQQQNHLKRCISRVFDTELCRRDFGQNFVTVHNLKCYDDRSSASSMDNFRLSQLYDQEHRMFMTTILHVPTGSDGFCFSCINVNSKDYSLRITKYYFSNMFDGNLGENMTVLDVQLYSTEFITVLLQHSQKEHSTILMQLPVAIALNNSVEHNIKSKACLFNENVTKVNLSPLVNESMYKVLEKMDGFRIAVSGGRKVAVVLSKSCRKVKVLEMHTSEEEDDTFESSVQSANTTAQGHNNETFETSMNESDLR